MRKRKSGPFVALSAAFPDDDDIVAVGERAAWLYVVMTCDCRLRRTDGYLTVERVSRLNVPGWRARLDSLIRQGLVTMTDDGHTLRIAAYLNWNPSEADYTARAEQRTRAACQRWHEQPCTACQDPPQPVRLAKVQ